MQDQKIYEPGTMVRIVDHKDSRLYNTLHLAAHDGWLWNVEEAVRSTQGGEYIYKCKSIATGDTCNIFARELTDAGPEDI